MTAVTLMGLITNELGIKSNESLLDFQTNVYALYDQFNFTPVYVEPLQNYSKYPIPTNSNHKLEQKVQDEDVKKIINWNAKLNNTPEIESIFVNNNDHPHPEPDPDSTSVATNHDSLSSYSHSISISNDMEMYNVIPTYLTMMNPLDIDSLINNPPIMIENDLINDKKNVYTTTATNICELSFGEENIDSSNGANGHRPIHNNNNHGYNAYHTQSFNVSGK